MLPGSVLFKLLSSSASGFLIGGSFANLSLWCAPISISCFNLWNCVPSAGASFVIDLLHLPICPSSMPSHVSLVECPLSLDPCLLLLGMLGKGALMLGKGALFNIFMECILFLLNAWKSFCETLWEVSTNGRKKHIPICLNSLKMFDRRCLHVAIKQMFSCCYKTYTIVLIKARVNLEHFALNCLMLPGLFFT